ncbi:MAG: flagellar M-ring protein FliF C-terminal domain-containing protein [Candidatus Velthaea sp.]
MNELAALARRLAASSLRLRIGIAVALLAVVVLASIALCVTQDTRVALFATPLETDQLLEVQTQLAAWNIPFALDASNVRVDRARRADVLLRLSLAGVPHAHLSTTEEYFAHAGALTPQSVLDAQTRDGLAGELALGLRGLSGVADARVIVAPAHVGAYADEGSHDASASVRLTLTPGAHFTTALAAGIKAFVAGGVPGLDPAHVTVLDDRGLVASASDPAAEDDADGAGIERALQSALDAAFGPGAAIVRVHRDARTERSDIQDVKRVSLGGPIVRTSSDERFASDKKRYSKSQGAEDRGSDTREEHRVALPGSTRRISVAVFVDVARSLDLDKIRALAAAAAGIDPSRGDVVNVEAVRFAAPPPAPRIDRWAVGLASALGIVPQLLVAGALVTAAGFGARPAYRRAVHELERAEVRRAAREVTGIPPLRVRGALAGEPPHIAAAIISALPAATAAAVLELYPAEERGAIVRRLSQERSPFVPPPEELFPVHG